MENTDGLLSRQTAEMLTVVGDVALTPGVSVPHVLSAGPPDARTHAHAHTEFNVVLKKHSHFCSVQLYFSYHLSF